jgi:hypothetical protein
MTMSAHPDVERQKLDRELDRELEATFPASDPLKLTRAGSQAVLERDVQPKGSKPFRK